MSKSTVLFDLGNTLVGYYKSDEFMPVLAKCVKNSCNYLASEGLKIEFKEALDKARTYNYEREDLAVWPINNRLTELFGIENCSDRLCIIFMQPIFDTAKLDPEAIPLLQSLRGKGFKVGIVSNTPWGSPSSLWNKELERHGLFQCSDAIVFCVDVGWRKPHKAIFEFALQQLNAVPEETVFVGDDPKWDIYGAEQAGIDPILISQHEPESPTAHPTIRSLSELHKHL